MSAQGPRTHALHATHKTETACGLTTRHRDISPEPTCWRCRFRLKLPLPDPPKPDPVPRPSGYPGAPARCEMVVRGGTGLELCGRLPCGTHAT